MPEEPKVTRKLRAILSADVKGYSILMAEDEVSTVQTLKNHRNIMSNCIEQYGGRVVDAVGDNLLAEFGSVVDAVQCAVEVQRILNEKNEEVPDARKLQFRIGVNIGDVIQDGERIFGDGVNIAARIEGLSDAGGISISRNAYDHVKNKLNLGYEYIGEHTVKNIKEPVRVYKVLLGHEDAGKLIGEKPKNRIMKWAVPTAIITAIIITSIVWYFLQSIMKPDIEPASVENMALELPDKPSIAVLPFNNFSKDSGQEYIADGITEHIITTLSQAEKLFIISRNSVFQYKDKPVAIKQVSEDLGVRYVLEGSVQISNNKIRITAQLIDTIKGSHVWAHTYDKKLEDIFHLQDEIALKLLQAMRVELTDGEQAKVFGTGTDNLKAYLQFLKGAEQLVKFTKEGTALVKKYAQAAIDIDPMYSSGYRLLAAAYLYELFLGVSENPKLSIEKGFKLLEKVRVLDEQDPGYYQLMGQFLLLTRQHDKAIAFGEQAVKLSPNNAGFIYGLATIFRYNGEPEKALPLQNKAIRLNPYPSSMFYMSLGHIYLSLERYEEASQAYNKAIHMNPDQFSSYMCLAGVYSRLGLKAEASAAMSKAVNLQPGLSVEYIKSLPFRHKKDLDFFITALEEAGIPKYPSGKEPDKPSIAVLPFDNLSDDPEQEYFSDGMTDELIADLAKIRDILVISRNSAFTYKGKSIKAQQIAQELNVRYILEGSVQRSANKVRIRAQLIDGETDHHLWSESYDGVMDDIFELQDKITGRIVSALAITLSTSEREKVGEKGTNNIMAYEAFLKGREHVFNMTPKDFSKAIEYYKQAVEIDPGFSRAYAAIGVVYQVGGNLNWSIKMVGDSTTQRLLARKYLELGMKKPTFEAYNLYAAKELHRRNFKEAEVFAQKAHEYAPNSAEGLRWLAWILAFTGRSKESIEYFHRAIRLDPFDKSLNTPVSNAFIGINHFIMGNLEEAVTYLEKGLSLNPKLTNFSCFLAASHALLGHGVEAKKALEDYLKEFPEWLTPNTQFIYGSWPFKDSNVLDRLAQGLVKAGLQGDPKNYYKVIEENKLDGQEIRKLLFGKTSTGYPFGIKELEWFSRISDDGKEEYSIMGNVYTGRAWIENENICLQRKQYKNGLKNCMEVYRNPDGDELAKTEYFRITDYGLFLFSVEK